MFTKIGDIKNCTYFRKKCLIEYGTTDECDRAISTYNGSIFGFENNKILVEYSDKTKSYPPNTLEFSFANFVNLFNTSCADGNAKNSLLNNTLTKNTTSSVVSSTIPLEKGEICKKDPQTVNQPKTKCLQVNKDPDNIKVENVPETLNTQETSIIDDTIFFDTSDGADMIVKSTSLQTSNIATEKTTLVVSLTVSTNYQKALQKLIPPPTHINKCFKANGVLEHTTAAIFSSTALDYQRTLKPVKPAFTNECPVGFLDHIRVRQVEKVPETLNFPNTPNTYIGPNILPPLNPRSLWSDEFIQDFNKIELPLLSLPTCFTCKRPGIYLSECCKKVFFCNHICLYNGFFAHLPFCPSNPRIKQPILQDPYTPLISKISCPTTSMEYSHLNGIIYSNAKAFNDEREIPVFAGPPPQIFPPYNINPNALNPLSMMKTLSESSATEPCTKLKNIDRHGVIMCSSVSDDRLGGRSVANNDHKNSSISSAGFTPVINKGARGNNAMIKPPSLKNPLIPAASTAATKMMDTLTGKDCKVSENNNSRGKMSINHSVVDSNYLSSATEPCTKLNHINRHDVMMSSSVSSDRLGGSSIANHDHKKSCISSAGFNPFKVINNTAWGNKAMSYKPLSLKNPLFPDAADTEMMDTSTSKDCEVSGNSNFRGKMPINNSAVDSNHLVIFIN